jgi:adenosylhomocysteinase
VEQFILSDDRKINLLGEGRLINLAAAEGHPSEVMDLSFSLQALASEFIVKNKGMIRKFGGKVLEIPPEIDNDVAHLKCEALEIVLDKLTPTQKKYLESWKTGT